MHKYSDRYLENSDIKSLKDFVDTLINRYLKLDKMFITCVDIDGIKQILKQNINEHLDTNLDEILMKYERRKNYGFYMYSCFISDEYQEGCTLNKLYGMIYPAVLLLEDYESYRNSMWNNNHMENYLHNEIGNVIRRKLTSKYLEQLYGFGETSIVIMDYLSILNDFKF